MQNLKFLHPLYSVLLIFQFRRPLGIGQFGKFRNQPVIVLERFLTITQIMVTETQPEHGVRIIRINDQTLGQIISRRFKASYPFLYSSLIPSVFTLSFNFL